MPAPGKLSGSQGQESKETRTVDDDYEVTSDHYPNQSNFYTKEKGSSYWRGHQARHRQPRP